MSRTACTEPQCLYNGALYLNFTFGQSVLSVKITPAFWPTQPPVQRIQWPDYPGRGVMLTTDCCILRVPGGERILDVVPRGTELGTQVKTGNRAGRTHNNPQGECTGVLLCVSIE